MIEETASELGPGESRVQTALRPILLSLAASEAVKCPDLVSLCATPLSQDTLKVNINGRRLNRRPCLCHPTMP